jgi:peroxiredoxin Q/BCP
MLEPGQEAPDFELPDQDGRPVKLSDFRGQTVVIYFYPDIRGDSCNSDGEALIASSLPSSTPA